MSPYLAKVSSLARPILLKDAYAGPGIFEDGQPSSPYIMCQAAERHAKGKYTAIFINKEEKYHKVLESVLQKEGWSACAHAYLGDSNKLIQLIPSVLKDHTVFLYLDPFGLKGCEFSTLEPFLNRNTRFSTEILLTISVPIIHRLAACSNEVPLEKGRIKNNRERLTKVFGGDYWQRILCQSMLSTRDRETQLIEAYRAKLKQYLPFVGSCPVRERSYSRTKYFIVFASRHQDAMLLLNDIMLNAYFTSMHQAQFAHSLFEEFHWSEIPPLEAATTENLETVVLNTVSRLPGATRANIWLDIIQNYFMRFRQSDYKNVVQQMVESNKLICPTPHTRKRLNDNCQLYLANIIFWDSTMEQIRHRIDEESLWHFDMQWVV
jgi:three-Cys-motif partner protein